MPPAKTKRKPRKPTPRKPAPRRRKKKSDPLISLGKIMWIVILMGMLVFSIGTLGYVIFFRTVSAAELHQLGVSDIVFEETNLPELVEPPIKREEGNEVVPRIAIIVDDMGFHPDIGKLLLDLPLNLTFSFLAGAPFTKALEKEAFEKKRTILLHLPLEPRDKKWNPGPDALYLGQLSEQRVLFKKNLMSVPHAVGVNNHMGSLYSEDEVHMAELLKLVAQENLFYIDSFTTAKSVGLRLAYEMGVKVARRHIFLDNIQSRENVCIQLEKLMVLAEQNGWAVGIGHPFKATFQGLSECGADLSERVELVGVDQLVQ